VPVKTVENLTGTERSSALALPASIYLDSEVPEDSPLTDFIVGHELSHVKNRDTLGTVAEANLLEWVESAAEGDSSLKSTAEELEKQFLVGQKEIESRADQDGYDFARAQGHTGDEVVEAATEFFGTKEVNDTHHNHPSPHKRVAALRERNEG